ncbi:MAG: hypothetical protein PVJ40_08940 [Gammaproteobacteria bacterium]|jgi:hypothetical protein
MNYLRNLGLAAAVAVLAACSANPLVKPSEPHGILSTRQSNLPQGLYPATIVQIDGRRLNQQSVSESARFHGRGTGKVSFWVAPGEHRVRVVPVFTDEATRIPSIEDRKVLNRGEITVNVEEGKTYFLAVKLPDYRGGKFKPVIVSVEDSGT